MRGKLHGHVGSRLLVLVVHTTLFQARFGSLGPTVNIFVGLDGNYQGPKK